jgi:hypothetical protein
MRRDLLRSALIVIVAGVALGVAMRALRYADAPSLPKIAALGVPWITTAFVVGALEREKWRAVCAAAAALVTAVVVYYVLEAPIEGHTSLRYAAAMTVAWSVAAVAVGAIFGRFGAAWRQWRSTFASAALGGAFVGEAMLLLVVWRADAAYTVLACELAVGIALPLALARPRTRAVALPLTLAIGLALASAEAAIRVVMHSAGWAGG